jgi:hypothetical protein
MNRSLWAIAFLDAYFAYGNATLLNMAEAIWNNATMRQITNSSVHGVNASNPSKNGTFLSSCNGSALPRGSMGFSQ